MNREIIFRGFSECSNTWVYGNLITDGKDNYIITNDKLKLKNKNVSINNKYIFYVYNESIGQYLNKKDKYNNKIFENDILKSEKNNEYLVYGLNEYGDIFLVNRDNNNNKNMINKYNISELEVVTNEFEVFNNYFKNQDGML